VGADPGYGEIAMTMTMITAAVGQSIMSPSSWFDRVRKDPR
jgi:hypothetical protein